jgi:hypothetical protein
MDFLSEFHATSGSGHVIVPVPLAQAVLFRNVFGFEMMSFII